jgi:hypothetical protein
VQTTEQPSTTANQLQLQQRVTSSAPLSPTIPPLPTQASPDISQSGYSISPQDILTEEMNISYQILNLRLLLERSMSDRIYRQPGDIRSGQRAQALLGFQVSIDPLKQHKHQAAIVQIELTGPTVGMAPSLVSLMPQAKTYNVAALSKKSSAFGVSAIVKVVTVGYNERHQAQSYYLYRDTDIIAFERQTAADKLTFGWEFRPVLNRTTVEAGLRQLFAVVSLNQLDESGNRADYPVQAKIKTYWTEFDKDAAVIASGPCEERIDTVNPILIPCSQTIQASLGPEVKSVEMSSVGQSNILINVIGNSFYAGTDVLLGDKVLNSSDIRLIIKNDHFLQIYASASDIVKSKVVIRGRYGLSDEVADKSGVTPDTFKLITTASLPFAPNNNPVKVQLEKVPGGGIPDLKGKLLVLTVGSQLFVIEPKLWRQNLEAQVLEITIPVQGTNLQSNTLATATFPLSSTPRTTTTLYNPLSVDAVTVLFEDLTAPGFQRWGIAGRGFSDDLVQSINTKVIAGTEYKYSAAPPNGLTKVSDNLLTIDVRKPTLDSISNVVVQIESAPAVTLPAPKHSVPVKMSFIAAVPDAPVGSAPAVEFSGDHFEQVTNVSFANTNLVYFPDPDGKKLHVFLTRDVTAKTGPVALPVRTKDGSTHIANVNVK